MVGTMSFRGTLSLLASLTLAESAALGYHHKKQVPVSAPDELATMPTSLAIFASQCKCKFIGLCSCRASVEFMDCIADACASGGCDCHEHQFEEACGNMSATCPSIGVQCAKDKATCLHHSHAEDEPTADILSDLEELRAKQCKLQKAHKMGFLNADNRMRELEAQIQARKDALIIKNVDCTPNMKCDDEPVCADSGTAASVPSTANNTAPAVSADVKVDDKAVVKKEKDAKEDDKVPAGTLSQDVGKKKSSIGVCLLELLGQILLFLLFAFLYDRFLRKNWKSGSAVGSESKEGFRFSLFGCFYDLKMTLLVFCCGVLRWADTLDKANDDKKTIHELLVIHRALDPLGGVVCVSDLSVRD